MQILISTRQTIPDAWLQAFPEGHMVTGPLQARVAEATIIWLDYSGLRLPDRALWLQQALDYQRPLVVLSPTPSDDEAMRALQQGATGYAHILAANTQLTQIATVLNQGGYWVGPQFMQRVMALIAEPERDTSVDDDQRFVSLTEREMAVAKAVGRGASNKEIAESMLIAERTVKAHLSSAFHKLGVRDRVQLALLIRSSSLQLA